MAKKKRGQPNNSNAAPRRTTQISANIQDYQFWLGLAREVVPGEKDEWRLGEIACLLQQFSIHVGGNYREISNAIEKTAKKQIKFTVPCEIDRANTPPEVFVGVGWTIKYGDGGTVKVPDPSQTELPMEVETGRRGPAEDESQPEIAGQEKEKE